jgi:uncharacterized membrane protein YbaN (DUF454 family)
MNAIKKYILIIIGLIALSLGFIGIIIPILPTTPFMLLAAYCFVRSSKRLYNWLINHKIFGVYIYNYLENRAIKKSAKISAMVLLWPSLIFTMCIIQKTPVTIILMIVGVFVSKHILSLKTLVL